MCMLFGYLCNHHLIVTKQDKNSKKNVLEISVVKISSKRI